MTDKRHDFLKGVAEIMEADVAKFEPEATLESLGPWDSMTVMQVVVLVDDIYGRVVHGRALAECVKVSDLLWIAEG